MTSIGSPWYSTWRGSPPPWASAPVRRGRDDGDARGGCRRRTTGDRRRDRRDRGADRRPESPRRVRRSRRRPPFASLVLESAARSPRGWSDSCGGARVVALVARSSRSRRGCVAPDGGACVVADVVRGGGSAGADGGAASPLRRPRWTRRGLPPRRRARRSSPARAPTRAPSAPGAASAPALRTAPLDADTGTGRRRGWRRSGRPCACASPPSRPSRRRWCGAARGPCP